MKSLNFLKTQTIKHKSRTTPFVTNKNRVVFFIREPEPPSATHLCNSSSTTQCVPQSCNLPFAISGGLRSSHSTRCALITPFKTLESKGACQMDRFVHLVGSCAWSLIYLACKLDLLPQRMERTETIDNFKVGSLPTLIYIPDFITDNEQTMLLNKIYEAPVSKWKSLKNRRLQNWVPSWLTKITYKIYEESGLFPLPINHVLINEYLPDQGIMAHQDGPAYYPVVAILSLRSPVVMDFTPHSRMTLCKSTCTNDVEDTNSDRGVIKIDTDKSMDEHHPFPVILMPCSLMIFKDTAYSDYLHAIKDSEVQCYDGAVNEVEALHGQVMNHASSQLDGPVDVMKTGDLKCIHRTTPRISLTCRLVPKVHKNVFRF
ncbi:alpha-ketoglutarate-dependent dioxygenase alkB homolog 6 isoform X3 [Prunus persica]|uniref:alpha-ketoglutarate-dependent dioxygenase alkB homolog 6 isoform X3 n=1 Tax=Prunus persica TaxID=3760 RepID=UPI0009AB9D44|nr:alpha-ketoglutarate-dependent dioxygenase alkB homolog 6 isoform X3 [Prunus persica]